MSVSRVCVSNHISFTDCGTLRSTKRLYSHHSISHLIFVKFASFNTSFISTASQVSHSHDQSSVWCQLSQYILTSFSSPFTTALLKAFTFSIPFSFMCLCSFSNCTLHGSNVRISLTLSKYVTSNIPICHPRFRTTSDHEKENS